MRSLPPTPPALIALLGFLALSPAAAQDVPPPPATEEAAPGMSSGVLRALVEQIDPEAAADGNMVEFSIGGRPLLLVHDDAAGRMRLMSPITPSANLNPALYERLMQANFDSALDARYAVAQDLVWSVFVHPLGSLTEDDFLSGIAQVVTAAETFGTSFTSGAIVFGGGDSAEINRAIVEQLEKALGRDI